MHSVEGKYIKQRIVIDSDGSNVIDSSDGQKKVFPHAHPAAMLQTTRHVPGEHTR